MANPAPHTPRSSGYRPDIDGLRAIAVLSVVAFHAFPGMVQGGFIGVDVFFVISGYLISGILMRSLDEGRFSYKDFYGRRIRRIFPALLLVLSCCLIAGWVLLTPEEHRQLGKHVAGGVAFISNFLLWQESGYFDEAAENKPLLHLWSLGIEEQFYILWPIVLVLLWKRRWNFPLVAGAIAVGSFAVNIDTVFRDPVAAFYSPMARFWELMAGAALAYGLTRWQPISCRTKNGFSVLGLLLIGSALALLTKDSVFPGAWALLPVAGAALLIAAGPHAAINHHLLSSKPMVWVGLISFPLYLWHWPLLALARIHEGGLPAREFRVAIVGMSLLLAWLTYRWLEVPLRHAKGHAVVAGLAGANVALLALGLALYANIASPGKHLTPTQAAIVRPLDASADYRRNTCFLHAKRQIASDFSASCDDAQSPYQKTLVLWGDSHAAHLYPGLDSIKSTLGFRLVQRTATSCPPLLSGNTEAGSNCNEINQEVLKQLAANPPAVLVMASRWSRDEDKLDRKLTETVNHLKSIGVRQIVVVGPPAKWTPTLKHFLVRSQGVQGNLKERYFPDASEYESIRELDTRIRALALKAGFEYISLIDVLCSPEGCRVKTGDNFPADLVSMDYDHFSRSASIFVAEDLQIRSALSKALAP